MSRLQFPFHIPRHSTNISTAGSDINSQKLQQTLLLTWLFISQEGLLDEAMDFLREHESTPLTIV